MNNFGYTRHGNFVCTYQIGETALSHEATSGKGHSDLPLILGPLGIGGYFVWPNGQDNMDPNISDEMISSNRLLPELIEKQYLQFAPYYEAKLREIFFRENTEIATELPELLQTVVTSSVYKTYLDSRFVE